MELSPSAAAITVPWAGRDTYASPVIDPQRIPRLFPTLRFAKSLAGIVWRASRRCQRNNYSDGDWIESSLATLRLLERCGVRIHIRGLDNLRHIAGPAIIIGNHMSTAETFLLPSMIATIKPVTFVVKSGLVEYPVFKHVMINRNPVVVGRQNPREDLRIVQEEGAARLAAGISLIIFPQSTRMVEFDPTQFNSIGVKLAKRAGVPVVPLALKTDTWGNGRYIKDLGRLQPSVPMEFAFGKPMPVSGTGKDEHAAIVDFIRDNLAIWS